MYTCVYIYIYTHIPIYIYIYICICIYTYVYTYTSQGSVLHAETCQVKSYQGSKLNSMVYYEYTYMICDPRHMIEEMHIRVGGLTVSPRAQYIYYYYYIIYI